MHSAADIDDIREEAAAIRARLRSSFATGKTKQYAWRIEQIKQAKRMVKENEQVFVDALASDLRRPQFEAFLGDLEIIYAEADMFVKHLSEWMKPVQTDVAAMVAPARSEIVTEPYGSTLILAPFNYPLQLMIVPMLGAIAAGNCVVVKPSELAPATEQAVNDLLPQYMDTSCISCICGGIATNTALLDLCWDKIFFTGSTRVGKIVMAAAAKHLTPVSLELGGKSPAYIDESVTDLEVATKRIIAGKMMNAGQTCVAPDYVLCHMKHYEGFLEQCARTVESFYGNETEKSESFCRIITDGHCERLKAMLQDENDLGRRRLICGGQVNVASKFIAPTVFGDVSLEDCLMQEEIFGPILPVIPVSSTDEAIKIMSRHEKPLALYMFSNNDNNIEEVFGRVTSGAAVANDCVVHLASSLTPFGGVGPSGLGNYRGKFSYDAFSHHKTVLKRDAHAFLDLPVRYPPYDQKKIDFIRRAVKLPAMPSAHKFFSFTFNTMLVVGIAAAGFFVGHRYGDQILK